MGDVPALGDPGVDRAAFNLKLGAPPGYPRNIGARLAQLAVSRDDIITGGSSLLAGPGVPALTGCLAIDFLLCLVRGRELGYFAMWCAVGGTLAIGPRLRGW